MTKKGRSAVVPFKVRAEMYPAEAGGWRAGLSKVTKRKDYAPILTSKWFKTEAGAKRAYNKLKRR